MLESLLTAVIGILIIMGAWFVIQAVVRKNSGCGSDRDVLEYLAHGCGACERSKACHNRAESAGREPAAPNRMLNSR
ncbi:MAG TPA: hypothetical protein VKU01_31800 [Bryobacteraceae bacterium]|nr:hypothetical protein [Bryobacteraceae bacterium]